MLHENLFWSGSRLQDIHPRNSSLLWSFCLFLFLISQVKVILSLIISWPAFLDIYQCDHWIGPRTFVVSVYREEQKAIAARKEREEENQRAVG